MDLPGECLESCYDELERSGLSGEVIVVENAFDDGNARMVQELFPQARSCTPVGLSSHARYSD
jgi:hypothetical protein